MFGLGRKKEPKPPKIIKDTKLNHGLRFSNEDVRWVVDQSKPILLFGDGADRMLGKITTAIKSADKQITMCSHENDESQVVSNSYSDDDLNKNLRALMAKTSSEIQDSGFLVVKDLAWAASIVEDPNPTKSSMSRAGNRARSEDPDMYATLNDLDSDLNTVTIASIALQYDKGDITVDELIKNYSEDVVMIVLTLASRSVDETASVYASRMKAMEQAGKALGLIIRSGMDYSEIYYDGENKTMLGVLDGDTVNIISNPFLLAVLHSCVNTGYGLIITVDSYDDSILPFMSMIGTRIMAGEPGDESWLLGTKFDVPRDLDPDEIIDLSGKVVISSTVYDGFMKIDHGVWPSPVMSIDRLNVDFV